MWTCNGCYVEENIIDRKFRGFISILYSWYISKATCFKVDRKHLDTSINSWFD